MTRNFFHATVLTHKPGSVYKPNYALSFFFLKKIVLFSTEKFNWLFCWKKKTKKKSFVLVLWQRKSFAHKFSFALTQTDRKKKKVNNFHFTEKKIKEEKLFFSQKFVTKVFTRKKNETAWSFKQSWMFEKDYKFAGALRASRRIKRLQKLFSYPYFNNI